MGGGGDKCVYKERPEKPLNRAEFSDCDCGCNIPVAKDPISMLKFLQGRMEFAGIADGVAAIYARDIKFVLDNYKPEQKALNAIRELWYEENNVESDGFDQRQIGMHVGMKAAYIKAMNAVKDI